MRLISSTPLSRREDWDSRERYSEVLLHGNEKYIAQSLNDRTIHVLDSEGILLRTIVHPVHSAAGLVFYEDTIAITSSKEAVLRIYSILSGLSFPPPTLHSVGCLPDLQLIILQ